MSKDLSRKLTIAPVAEPVFFDSSSSGPSMYFYLDTQYSTLLRTVNNGGNFALYLATQNYTGAVNDLLAVGEMKTITYISLNSTTAYKLTTLYIDGAAQTIKWAGGTAPAGTASAYDAYTFTIIKTAANTYTVLGNYAAFK